MEFASYWKYRFRPFSVTFLLLCSPVKEKASDSLGLSMARTDQAVADYSDRNPALVFLAERRFLEGVGVVSL